MAPHGGRINAAKHLPLRQIDHIVATRQAFRQWCDDHHVSDEIGFSVLSSAQDAAEAEDMVRDPQIHAYRLLIHNARVRARLRGTTLLSWGATEIPVHAEEYV